MNKEFALSLIKNEIGVILKTAKIKYVSDIFDDKLPEGVFIKGGLNGFGIVIVVSEKNAFSPFHSLIGKLEITIVFSGSLEKIPWNDSMREKTYLKSYRMNPTYNTSIPSSFNAGSWSSK